MLFPLYPHILMVKKPQLRPTPDLQCSASACSFASWKASNGRWTPRCFAVKLHKKTVSWATVTVSEHLHCYITRIYPWFFCKCTGLKYIIWLITYYIIQVYCIQNMKKCLLYTTCGWKYLEKRESLEWIAGASTLEMLGVLSHLIIHIQMDSYGIIWGVLKS